MTRLRLLAILSALLCLGASAQAQGAQPAQDDGGWVKLVVAGLVVGAGQFATWFSTRKGNRNLSEMTADQTKAFTEGMVGLGNEVRALRLAQENNDVATTDELALHGDRLMNHEGRLVSLEAWRNEGRK